MIPTTRLVRVSWRAWGVRSRSTQKLTKTERTSKGTGFATRALNSHPTFASEPPKVASATSASTRLRAKAPKATHAAGSRSRINFSTPFSVSTLALPRGCVAELPSQERHAGLPSGVRLRMLIQAERIWMEHWAGADRDLGRWRRRL